MSRRHPPPTYEEDQAADPYVYDDGDEPDYDDPNYTSEDPNPHLADEEYQETDEDLARMHQREIDEEVAENAAAFEGDIDEDNDGWLDESRNEEEVRRELADRESGFGREELDSTYDVEDDEDD